MMMDVEDMAMSKSTVIVVALVMLGAGQALVPARQADRPEQMMQAARNKQVVEGKLDEAIAIYREVVARNEQNRPVAARALAALGQCYEKLGAAQVAEARKAYERILRQYPEQADAAAQARGRLAALAAVEKAPAGLAHRALAVRRIWPGMDVSGQVSPDGQEHRRRGIRAREG